MRDGCQAAGVMGGNDGRKGVLKISQGFNLRALYLHLSYIVWFLSILYIYLC